jgi:hypothetical protein
MTTWTLDREQWLALVPYIDDVLLRQSAEARRALLEALVAGECRLRAGFTDDLLPAVELWVRLAGEPLRLFQVPAEAVGVSEDDWSHIVDIESTS